MCVIPATFMSAVSITYFFMAPECLGAFGIGTAVAYPVGIVAGIAFLAVYLRAANKHKDATPLNV